MTDSQLDKWLNKATIPCGLACLSSGERVGFARCSIEWAVFFFCSFAFGQAKEKEGQRHQRVRQ